MDEVKRSMIGKGLTEKYAMDRGPVEADHYGVNENHCIMEDSFKKILLLLFIIKKLNLWLTAPRGATPVN